MLALYYFLSIMKYIPHYYYENSLQGISMQQKELLWVTCLRNSTTIGNGFRLKLVKSYRINFLNSERE